MGWDMGHFNGSGEIVGDTDEESWVYSGILVNNW